MKRLGLLTAVLLLLTPAAGICQAGARQECPRVVLACPVEELDQSVPATFRAEVGGGDPNARYTFNWTTSAGTVVSGQGTPFMTLDATGLGGLTIKVTVEVAGLPQSCASSESCEAGMRSQPLPWHPFDQYSGDLHFSDEIPRLDNLAVNLQNSPTAKGYIVVFPGEGARPDAVKQRARRARSYLTRRRGIDAARLVLFYAERLAYTGQDGLTQLWVIPEGLDFPVSGQVIKPGGGVGRKGHRRKR